jgi:F0F1-type ATP synthase epsilon subunit
MLEVQPNLVSVLADTAIRGKGLDEAKAKAEPAEAIAQLTGSQKLRKPRH